MWFIWIFYQNCSLKTSYFNRGDEKQPDIGCYEMLKCVV